MVVPVTAYALSWSIANGKGAVYLQVGGRPYQLPVSSLEELMRLSGFLREAPALAFETNGQMLIHNWVVPSAGQQTPASQLPAAGALPASKPPQMNADTPSAKSALQLFISHSSEDSALARHLAELFRVALRLPASSIRCSSVDGYRLPAGADTDDQLRREVHEAAVCVGVVSAASLKSVYVLFELGARWGAGLPMLPLLARGIKPATLSGPLAGLTALPADDPSALHQLVAQVAFSLNLASEPPAVYHPYIELLLAAQQKA